MREDLEKRGLITLLWLHLLVVRSLLPDEEKGVFVLLLPSQSVQYHAPSSWQKPGKIIQLPLHLLIIKTSIRVSLASFTLYTCEVV